MTRSSRAREKPTWHHALLRVLKGDNSGAISVQGNEVVLDVSDVIDQVKERLPAVLGPVYEKPFSAYGDYRPWRLGLLGNIERTYAMVS